MRSHASRLSRSVHRSTGRDPPPSARSRSPRFLASVDTLIAAGAKAVVAPLWPVRLDVARGVAEAVLHGLADGREPFEVLAAMRATAASSPTSSSSVTLGPAAPLSKQAGLADLQRLAFVTWVG